MKASLRGRRMDSRACAWALRLLGLARILADLGVDSGGADVDCFESGGIWYVLLNERVEEGS